MNKIYFTKEAVNFYENLKKNNNKEWFAENRHIYDNICKNRNNCNNCHSEPTIVGEESYNVPASKNYRLFGSASTSPLSDIKCCKKMGVKQLFF